MYQSDDAGVRKMAVYALGSMPVDAGNETLVKALEDARGRRAVERRRSRWPGTAVTKVCRCCGACSTARTSSGT